MTKMPKLGMFVLLFLGLACGILSLQGDDSTTGGSSANPNAQSTSDFAGFSEAIIKSLVEQAETANDTSAPAGEHNTIVLKADTTGQESFSVDQVKTINHHIYWTNPNDVPAGSYFLEGYIKISFDSNVVQVMGVTSGLFSTGISSSGPGWVIVNPWYFFFGVPPVNDPAQLAFSITYKGKPAGTTTFTYDITNSAGVHRGWFYTGTVHNMIQSPVRVEFLPLITPPNAPTNLVATAVSESGINLTWQDNATNEQGFKIERKLSCHDPFIQIATVGTNEGTGPVNYSDTGLSPGTVYYYRVCAYNEAGNSGYSNMAAAVTFAHIPTIDETITVLNNVKDGILKPGLYPSFSDQLNQAKYYLGLNDYTNALILLNSIANKIPTLTDEEMTAQSRTKLLVSVTALIDYLSIRTSLPTTLTIYLSEEICTNIITFQLPNNGGTVSTTLTGKITLQLSATNNPDIASLTVTQSPYKGTAFTINGVDVGELNIANDPVNASTGTLNLATGQISLTHNVLVTNPYFSTPIALSIPLTGTFYPMSLPKGIVKLIGGGNIPADTPSLGGARYFMVYRADASPLKIRLVTDDGTGGITPVGEYLPVSDPAPELTINEVLPTDVTIDQNGYIAFTVSGTIKDHLADILANGQGQISAVKIFANGEEIATVSVTGQSEPASYFRPYAWKGTFTSYVRFKSVDYSIADANEVRVEAQNIIGNAGSGSLCIYILPSDSSFIISSVSINTSSLPGAYHPIMVEVTGNKQAALSGDFVGNFFGKDWNIVPVSYSPEHYLLGEYNPEGKGEQRVFVVVVEEAPGVDISTVTTPVKVVKSGKTLEAKLKKGNAEVNNAKTDLVEMEVILTHTSVDKDNCPKPSEDVTVYCIVKMWAGKEKGYQYYYTPTGPNDVAPNNLLYWDKKSYVYAFKKDKRTYQWVRKLTEKVALTQYPDISYQWFEVLASREPVITNRLPNDLQKIGHKGQLINYKVNLLNWPNSWKRTGKISEGCHFYFAKVTLKIAGKTIESYDFPVGTKLTGSMEIKSEALDRLKYAHEILCGDYAGKSRTVWEWARTHIGLPYGFGAKDREVDEDCSGLVASSGLQSDAIPAGKMDIWSAAYMVDMAEGIEPPKKVIYTVGEGEGETPADLLKKLQEIDSKDNIQPGDLIAHGKSWRTWDHPPKYPGHIVIVEKVTRASGKITAIDVIESVGFDDMDEAEDRIDVQVTPVPKNGTECTRRTEYIATYLNLKGTTYKTKVEKPYIGKFWILRFGEKPKKK